MSKYTNLRSLINDLYLSLHHVRERAQTLVQELADRKKSLMRWAASRIQGYLLKLSRGYITLLPGIPQDLTRYVDGSIVDALKLLIAKEAAINYQIGEGLRTKPIGFDLNTPHFSQLQQISRRGLLKVLLTTFLRLLPNLAIKSEQSSIKKESIRILNFVYSLAILDKWQPKDVCFEGDLLQFAVVPVAARYPNAADFYARRIESYGRRKNIQAIFVLAIGFVNSAVAEKAAGFFQQKNSKGFEIRIKNNYRVLCRRRNQLKKNRHKAKATTILLARRLNMQ